MNMAKKLTNVMTITEPNKIGLFNVGLGLNSGSGTLLFSIFCYDYNYKLNNFLMYF